MEMETSVNGGTSNVGGSGPGPGPAGVMTSAQIKEMMANAQKIIEQRKKALLGVGNTTATLAPSTIPSSNAGVALPPPGIVIPQRLPQPGLVIPQTFATSANTTPIVGIKRPYEDVSDIFEGDKKKKLAELQAQIQNKLASGILGKDNVDAAAAPGPSKPVPLLLDKEGRAIDISGNQLLFPQHRPTLKANIRAQKKAEHKHKDFKDAQEMRDEEAAVNKYFDIRLPPTISTKQKRAKKALQFNEPGKYVALAHQQRMKATLAKLQFEIADKARKTGISTAARLARLSGAVASSSEKSAEYIPQVEWWDSLLFEDIKEKEDGGDEEEDLLTYDSPLRKDCVTSLIEHPTQLRCPTDPHKPVYVPVFLTKKEQRKLRRQNRRENWKEKQEKIRLGLEAADQPKVRISNLMRVLGVEAVQDPTKIEAHVRQQMAKRLKLHKDANLARKLTPEQKKEKKLKKIKEDVTLGVQVSVYRIDDLSNQAKKYKVETNAKQLTMTGCVLLYRECNVVVVEGGPKQQRKYKKLMMSRIKWDKDYQKDKPDTLNKCVLVWEGAMKERAFSDVKFKYVQTEEQGREYFKKHGIEHFWDLALSGTVLESITEEI